MIPLTPTNLLMIINAGTSWKILIFSFLVERFQKYLGCHSVVILWSFGCRPIVSRFGLVSEILYGKLCKLSNVDVFCLLKTKLILHCLLGATATAIAFFASIAVNILLSFNCFAFRVGFNGYCFFVPIANS